MGSLRAVPLIIAVVYDMLIFEELLTRTKRMQRLIRRRSTRCHELSLGPQMATESLQQSTESKTIDCCRLQMSDRF